MKRLLEEDNKEELQKCFGARMEFGTAGLRAMMGAGISRMNDLTIIQTTQVPHLFFLVILNIAPLLKDQLRHIKDFKISFEQKCV